MKDIENKLKDLRDFQTNTFSSANIDIVKNVKNYCIICDLDTKKFYKCSKNPLKVQTEIKINEI